MNNGTNGRQLATVYFLKGITADVVFVSDGQLVVEFCKLQSVGLGAVYDVLPDLA